MLIGEDRVEDSASTNAAAAAASWSLRNEVQPEFRSERRVADTMDRKRSIEQHGARATVTCSMDAASGGMASVEASSTRGVDRKRVGEAEGRFASVEAAVGVPVLAARRCLHTDSVGMRRDWPTLGWHGEPMEGVAGGTLPAKPLRMLETGAGARVRVRALARGQRAVALRKDRRAAVLTLGPRVWMAVSGGVRAGAARLQLQTFSVARAMTASLQARRVLRWRVVLGDCCARETEQRIDATGWAWRKPYAAAAAAAAAYAGSQGLPA